jgi:hypothetical protein
MGEHGLSRNRETESRAARFVSYVRIPDLRDVGGRDSLAGIGDLDAHGFSSAHSIARRADSNLALAIARVDSVEYDIRESARKRVMMPDNMRQVFFCIDRDFDAGP